MDKVAIIDYGMCNLDSVARAVEECGGAPVVTSEPKELKDANRIILPGVGAFADGMRHLRERGLEEPLREQVLGQKVPFLGICLGMQFLATKGFEGGETPGLSIFKSGFVSGMMQRRQYLMYWIMEFSSLRKP